LKVHVEAGALCSGIDTDALAKYKERMK
jgi:hypothetical protein